MSEADAGHTWQHHEFCLIVAGKGERTFLPKLFRSLMETGKCHFYVIAKIGQLDPIASPDRIQKMAGRRQAIPPDDETRISLPARKFISQGGLRHLILIDDLEKDREPTAAAVFRRYREALDLLLTPEQRQRVSVHFLVYMLEAYYLADAKAVNAVLRTALGDHAGDVEQIPHPKNYLKQQFAEFDEFKYGDLILQRLDLPRVLSDPETCRSLRTLFKWCCERIGEPLSERFQLARGQVYPITASQLASY